MASLIERGSRMLARRLSEGESSTVVYARDTDSVEISASRGSSPITMMDRSGIGIELQSVDFIVTAANLKFGSSIVEPKSGDTITDGDERFEVLHVPGAAPYRYMDGRKILMRIHTKQVS